MLEHYGGHGPNRDAGGGRVRDLEKEMEQWGEMANFSFELLHCLSSDMSHI